MALMPDNPDLLTRSGQFAVKFCKENELGVKRCSSRFCRLGTICNQPQDLHTLSAPFTLTVLLGDNSHFLSYFKAVKIALVALADRNIVPENDLGMRDLDPPKHVIASLDKNPPRPARHRSGGIDNSALEHAVHGKQRHREKQDGRKQYPGPAMLHKRV